MAVCVLKKMYLDRRKMAYLRHLALCYTCESIPASGAWIQGSMESCMESQDAIVDRGEAKSEMQKFRFVEEIGP